MGRRASCSAGGVAAAWYRGAGLKTVRQGVQSRQEKVEQRPTQHKKAAVEQVAAVAGTDAAITFVFFETPGDGGVRRSETSQSSPSAPF